MSWIPVNPLPPGAFSTEPYEKVCTKHGEVFRGGERCNACYNDKPAVASASYLLEAYLGKANSPPVPHLNEFGCHLSGLVTRPIVTRSQFDHFARLCEEQINLVSRDWLPATVDAAHFRVVPPVVAGPGRLVAFDSDELRRDERTKSTTGDLRADNARLTSERDEAKAALVVANGEIERLKRQLRMRRMP